MVTVNEVYGGTMLRPDNLLATTPAMIPARMTEADRYGYLPVAQKQQWCDMEYDCGETSFTYTPGVHYTTTYIRGCYQHSEWSSLFGRK